MEVKHIDIELDNGKKVGVNAIQLTPKLKRKLVNIASQMLAKPVEERITEPRRM